IQFKNTQIRFHQGVAWMVQIIMFVTLGLLVFPHHLIEVTWSGLAVCFFLILVARPVSVFFSIFWSRFSIRGLALVSWVGLRGAIPIILATYPLLAQVEKSQLIFNIVFFVVISSSLIQGTTVSWLARKLNLTEPLQEFLPPTIRLPVHLQAEILQFTLSENSKLAGQDLLQLKLPPGSGICLIMRGPEVLTPLQATKLEAGDTVFVLANRESLSLVQEIFSEQA
ncbi:MAG: cation:proton antiporter, partial [candidate division Zixibacteria bacterium]|nr:cation:proton antiporter [candidate division Zixibacteria bacterium]